MKFADHSFPKDARFGNNLSCSFQEVKNVQRIDINGAICHMSDSGDVLVFFLRHLSAVVFLFKTTTKLSFLV